MPKLVMTDIQRLAELRRLLPLGNSDEAGADAKKMSLVMDAMVGHADGKVDRMVRRAIAELELRIEGWNNGKPS